VAFIRKKGGYYYKVESYRENGHVRQRTLAYLGKNPPRGPHSGLRGSARSATPVLAR
jgi:hypothetical protein